MGLKSRLIFLLAFIFLIVVSLNFISAWAMNGTVYDLNGTVLYNASINITVRHANFTIAGYNITYSNQSGWFNFTVYENVSWMYQPVIRHFINNRTNGSTAIDFIGQSLPAFPYAEIINMSNLSFYLNPAGTINITAINSSADRVNFNYMVKDTILGYSIANNWDSATVSEAIIYVPRNRNYSVMVYPNANLPVSFNWGNFTANLSYNLSSDNLSQYTLEKYTIQKQFNLSISLVRINGNFTSAAWTEMTIIPFLLEAGNMIYLSEGDMPYNMSAWWPQNSSGYQQSDDYDLNPGSYNLTLPGAHEGVNYILFASGRNATGFYGGYRNLTLTYSSSSLVSFNFSMVPLMGETWATTTDNISSVWASNWSGKTISSSMKQFNLVNSSNGTLSNLAGHIEITVNYSSWGAEEFTFMSDTSQTANASFYLPLLNVTGIKEMNIFSMGKAPLRAERTVAQIGANPNFTLGQFNPGDIGDSLSEGSISVSIFKSNSSCDTPNPHSSCTLASSASMDTFNPLGAIIGGGQISFRMGTANINIHYVNVDMLASGPPDGLFDNDAGGSDAAGKFENALRFGSKGPKIYDYILISIPYSVTAGSGLDETANVNFSIPNFYNDDWNVIWNVSANGSSSSAFAANFSHYNAKQNDWTHLMGTTNCTTTETNLNASTPCFIDTASNRIWIRIPHFTGTGPSISGTSSSAGSSSGGSSGSSILYWGNTYLVTDEQFSNGIEKNLMEKERAQIRINNEFHYIGIVGLSSTEATINISSTPIQVKLKMGDDAKAELSGDNYYDIYIKLNNILENKVNLTIKKINEKIPEGAGRVSSSGEVTSSGDEGTTPPKEEEKKSLLGNKTLIIIITLIILIIAILTVIKKRK